MKKTKQKVAVKVAPVKKRIRHEVTFSVSLEKKVERLRIKMKEKTVSSLIRSIMEALSK